MPRNASDVLIETSEQAAEPADPSIRSTWNQLLIGPS